jgi:pyruvate/2-oxoglutarate dehydrogenase complex dihydrolipoamide acyltransferase (E2) component
MSNLMPMPESTVSSPTQVFVNRESVNDDFVIIRRIAAHSGALVEAGSRILDIETSKTLIEVTAPSAGYLSLAVSLGDEVAIGALLFEIDAQTPASGTTRASNPPLDAAPTNADVVLSELAAAVVPKSGIPAGKFPVGAWITRSDIAGNRKGAVGPNATHTPSLAVTPLKDDPPRRVEPMNKRKLVEIQNLQRGNAHGAISTIGATARLCSERIVKPPSLFRNSITDLAIYEVSRLLRSYQNLNACWFDERNIALFEQINVGVSFDSGSNLKVLTVYGANELNLVELQSKIEGLLDLYESGRRLDQHLMVGSTITISDLSAARAEFMLPLINGQQSLILGITKPTAECYGFFATFDHRVSDGLEVTRFLNELVKRIESYFHSKEHPSQIQCAFCARYLSDGSKADPRGFVRTILPNGTDGVLCRNCFDGW